MGGLALVNVTACNLKNPGTDPPRGALSYPIGVALGAKDKDGKADVLYVVNSNFDLRYNAGSVQAYDLSEIADAIAECESVGVPEGGIGALDAGLDASLPDAGLDAGTPDAGLPDGGMDAGLIPGFTLPPDAIGSGYETLRGVLCDGRDREGGDACCFDRDETAPFLKGEVLIDSYATGLAFSEERNRLYVPIRARDRLLYIGTGSDGALSCDNEGGRCTRGTDQSDKDLDPDVAYPVQPQALTIGKLSDLVPATEGDVEGTFIATVHQNGSLALLVDKGEGATGPGPVLHSVAVGGAFANAVALNPIERLLYTSSGDGADIARWGVERRSTRNRWILYQGSTLRLALTGAFYDIRDLQIDPADPSRVFALMRGRLESVLFVQRDPDSPSEAFITSATRVGAGPSKLAHAVLGDRKLLFASCFDSRAIFVIDESNGELVSVIRGLSGPFDMAVDEARKRLYVADFRANVLRVVDVQGLGDSRLPPPRIIATLGKPTFGGKLE